MANRRSVLIGLGGLVAGGGAILGTGAFTTVTAERTVNVETAGDASAFLGLAPADRDGNTGGTQNQYVSQSGGDDDQTVEISLENPNGSNGANASGLNESAITVFRNLVTVTNNGTQEVTSLNLDITGEASGNLSGNYDSVFGFTVSQNSNQGSVNNNNDILTGNNSIPDGLGPGEAINFGLKINLLDSGVTEIPADSSFTLQITANTENSN
ncbi:MULTISPECIES: hypothetical protein [Halorubrum]|uniref:hypothetical protein n=1 Tax=Halorubrum TaxID=56688 RepID=UPI0010F97334|nr:MULTISPECIES: hypothetical protein [Halorubrum]TKX71205.1 hypothetical protein EXE40_08200 [Halorubrum sp. GN11GM_10-3_MGM]